MLAGWLKAPKILQFPSLAILDWCPDQLNTETLRLEFRFILVNQSCQPARCSFIGPGFAIHKTWIDGKHLCQAMSEPIILYDIPSTVPGQAWSPNPCKTRYCLNYKGLPYKTVWVEYPDIEALSKKIGTLPTDVKNGKPFYSLPAIYDPNTKTALAESALIAEYLDATYPDTPKLFPVGTHALQHAFVAAFMQTLSPVWQFALPAANNILNPPSEVYFRRTREAMFGKKLEDVVPTGLAANEEWAKVKAAFDTVDGWLQKGQADGPYLTGKEPAFADFVVASSILCFKKIWGAESSQWKDVMSWNTGRWEALIKEFEKYETIV
ncbi:putative glutathione S-transferase, N-terminal domain [Lyophyllum shimeji]|uniref:Glutathione S-transferase, N-terminal domain n=1 Tax=Lyophyllum shimeji TaxID=47721 RepID=A0A9P3PMV4_LYOSH|nr:putative glutathione S-transferase, N-terminal domain [Lyophyllum shimeji]